MGMMQGPGLMPQFLGLLQKRPSIGPDRNPVRPILGPGLEGGGGAPGAPIGGYSGPPTAPGVPTMGGGGGMLPHPFDPNVPPLPPRPSPRLGLPGIARSGGRLFDEGGGGMFGGGMGRRPVGGNMREMM